MDARENEPKKLPAHLEAEALKIERRETIPVSYAWKHPYEMPPPPDIDY